MCSDFIYSHTLLPLFSFLSYLFSHTLLPLVLLVVVEICVVTFAPSEPVSDFVDVNVASSAAVFLLLAASKTSLESEQQQYQC